MNTKGMKLVEIKVHTLSTTARHPTGSIVHHKLWLDQQGFKDFVAGLTAFLGKYEAFRDERS